MSEQLKKWIEESVEWKRQYKELLENCTDNIVVIPYDRAAYTFPLDDQNRFSFSMPRVDSEQMREWAIEIGWTVKPHDEGHHLKGHPNLVSFLLTRIS